MRLPSLWRLPDYSLPVLVILALAAALLWTPADSALARNAAGPKIADGPTIASSPASGDTYRAGETISVTLTFSEPVTVTGKPRLRLVIGKKKRWAGYDRTGEDGATLSFTHKVKSDDADTDGISIGKNQLRLNGGTIADADGNAAKLKHKRLRDQAGHKVNGAPDEPAPPEPEPPQPQPEPTATPTPQPQQQQQASNSEPHFAGDTVARGVNENAAAGTNVGNPVTATDDDGDNLTYALTGADAGSFDFDTASGQITVKDALNYEANASYTVTVTVHDGKDTAGEADTGVDDTITVTVSVVNVDEAGVVSLVTENNAPEVDREITAVLLDPDGGVNGETWTWARSTDSSEWTAIADAAGSAYTPTDDDADHYLRATASYDDGQGSGKTARAQTPEKVAAAIAARPISREPQNTGPTAQTVPADWSLKPAGVTSGQSFRLLFVTSGKRNAQSSNIGDYNTFVQNAANNHVALQPFKDEFRAVISTGTVDARDNTATTFVDQDGQRGVPIYWVGGVKVADQYKDFYDGSWDSGAWKTESEGTPTHAGNVWTGSTNDGTGKTTSEAGTSNVAVGKPSSTSPFNLADELAFRSAPLYGLSPVLTVADPAPSGLPKPQTVPANWSLIPSGVTPGESFRLLFITSTTRTAEPTDIGTYNTFVQARANAISALQPFKSEFRVVGSTGAVDARDNTATTYTNTNKGVPIYWVGGAKVADDYSGFYDGSWDSYAGKTETRAAVTAGLKIWTGTQNNGTKPTRTRLGGGGPGFQNAITGSLEQGKVLFSGGGDRINKSKPFYALSPVLTVDTARPVSPRLYTVTPGNRIAAVHWTIPRYDDTLARWQYRLKPGGGEYGAWRNMSGSSKDSWNYTVRGLTNGTAYTIQIRSVSKKGVFGLPSEEQTVTPYALTAPTARTVPANWGLIPEGVKPGQSFRLMFITYDRTNAESKHINTYNSFVQAQAAAATADYPGGVSKAELRPVNISGEFRALMSTATVDARANTATTGRGVPIYWVGGEKVADNYADFYDGSWDKPSYGYHQSGLLDEYGLVWTGSNANGTKHKYGFASGFYTRVAWGSIPQPGSRIGGGTSDREQLNALYAISPVLTVAR